MDIVDPRRRTGYVLEREDDFAGPDLDRSLWFPHHLPQWSSRDQAAARYRLDAGLLRLVVEADQPPWCPEFDGGTRVSSLQTGVFSGPAGSVVGQHRFTASAVVREPQDEQRLFVPQYGFFEMRARVGDDPNGMAALWMIGFEDRPERSAEICVFEIFGRDVAPGRSGVGMGVHPFGAPTLTDRFSRPVLPIDARDFHVYAVEWAPGHVAFFVDAAVITVVEQSPAYPMQFMLGTYAFPADDGSPPPGPYPKEFVVDSFRAYRRTDP
ncbi:glycoside hydrolase family 16 protein [Blastococcus sp. PRF04-17]|uniref:glycoside hydrolase family 16 protein n=1 Tax=Blastococcus sp. PRF04-17 TaxID=2933797 RepID=UPI001FF569EF|nr:glycoside hydrolase family 16 protein [Blastococcus sp. PRF04-17]UOY01608.1 glycoside hydrolase family 16 protein [Blastococcus sp. PRF04-17]